MSTLTKALRQICRGPKVVVLVLATLPLTSVSARSGEAQVDVSATTVIDKTISGEESVRALFQNNSGKAIVVLSQDVKYYVALAPSDPAYNTTPTFLSPSKEFHALGAPCLYQTSGSSDMTVTTPNGKTVVTDRGPRITPEPTFPIAPSAIVANGTTTVVGPIQHFDNFHCGNPTPHAYLVYSVIPWTYQNSGSNGGEVQTTTSPTISVSVP